MWQMAHWVCLTPPHNILTAFLNLNGIRCLILIQIYWFITLKLSGPSNLWKLVSWTLSIFSFANTLTKRLFLLVTLWRSKLGYFQNSQLIFDIIKDQLCLRKNLRSSSNNLSVNGYGLAKMLHFENMLRNFINTPKSCIFLLDGKNMWSLTLNKNLKITDVSVYMLDFYGSLQKIKW